MTQENKNITYGIVKYTIGIIVFIVPIIMSIANNNNDINIIRTKQNEIQTHFKEEELEYSAFKERINKMDVNMAEIKTSLEYIKSSNQDILSRLPKYNYEK